MVGDANLPPTEPRTRLLIDEFGTAPLNSHLNFARFLLDTPLIETGWLKAIPIVAYGQRPRCSGWHFLSASRSIDLG